MIDVSQWRASIGLWHYCQAASSRPANGHQCHSFKGAIDSKSKKTTKLPAAIPIIALFLLYLCYPIPPPPTGIDNFYLLVLPGATAVGSSSNFICFFLSLIVRLLLLLSGDVELNPGPTINDRPDMSLLIQWLDPLVDWKPFARCLPGIKHHDISKIVAENRKVDDQKLALYSKWLDITPNATWKDVINTLKKRRENKLVQDIKENLQKHIPNSDPPARGGLVTVQEKVMFDTAEDEKEILRKLIELNKTFSSLIMHVRSGLEKKNEGDPKLLVNLGIWIEAYMNWNDKLTNVSLNETFKIIHPFYDFIDCALIVDMSEVFLEDFKFSENNLNIVSELQKYNAEADKLRASAKVKHLNEALEAIYEEHIPDVSNMPTILIKLHNPWQASSINGLSLLIHKLLPVQLQQSLMKYITIKPGSVIIKYAVYGCAADSLIEYAGGKLQFMRLIGIFSLYINDHAVLQEDENMNFTFELALHEAATAGHNEAVEFLLQLETVNIDHTNEKGKTALMLACKKGHEDIAHSLLSAGANVNLQDNNGWTALMKASEHNHTSIINMLLQANANPHLKISDGSNALMIASFYGNYEVVKLLISMGVDYKYPRGDGWNAFMLACQNGHTQIVELLLNERVDPNVQRKSGGNAFMLACQNGRTQIVELLLKERVDPNVQNKDGVNAFMLACQNGHTQIVELLLKEQVDPNVQTNKSGNAFMLACQNGHTQIVEQLLKKKVDPNVQNEDGWNAFMLACNNGHTQIAELLLKEQVDPNVQNNNGYTSLMLASAKGYYEVVKLLLKWKVNPNIESKKGRTAFSYAKNDAITALIQYYLHEQSGAQEDTASSRSSRYTLDSGFRSNTVASTHSTRSVPSASSFNDSGHRSDIYDNR